MKKNTHPDYQEVVFEDSATGKQFLCGTTLKPKEMVKYQGKDYPLYKMSTSSFSHPFFTGSNKLVDSQGRIDKFKKRYAAAAAVKPPVEKTPSPDLKKGKKK